MASENPNTGAAGNNEKNGVQPAVVQATVLGTPAQAVMVVPNLQMPHVIYETGFGDFPQRFTCQWCGTSGTSIVQSEVSGGTMALAGVICVIGCDCGCCLIPFCLDSCKEKQHFCPSCGRMVARKRFLF
eukprot:TRINITY_DN69828_c0_g1_i1.p1 TRINITY_DN69828_c0_g1~~TRINITY_DN69828_c0_g1_i1.p1  ORF type:complete len:129 (-),score=17.11 TRINITY_DN69828_c0_g1_i1:94-480(-)